MLAVWGRRNSQNVQKVLWLIGELGLPYLVIPAGGSFGRLDEAAFRALNPHGLVPVLQDDDLAVWESHAILRYLARALRRGEFLDRGSRCRGRKSTNGWTGRRRRFNRIF